MTDSLKTLLSLSFSGAVLILLLLAARPLYKNRLGKAWQYYIWLVVLLRLLLPFAPDHTLSDTVFQQLDGAIPLSTEAAGAANGTTPAVGLSDWAETDNNDSHLSSDGSDWRFSPSELAWLIWAVVAMGLLVRKITLYQSFLRYIKAGRTEVADPYLLNLLAETGEAVGVKRPVELYTNPLVSTPMLMGLFHPFIVLPGLDLETTQLGLVFRHELTHCKRLDLLYKWLAQGTVCLHWFNPLVYPMVRVLNQCCELSCDEAMLTTLSEAEKKSYGDTLLCALNGSGRYWDGLASQSLSDSAEQLKERLAAIMNDRKKSGVRTAITLVLTIGVCVGAVTMGAYAAKAPAAAKPAPTPSPAFENTEKAHIFTQGGYYEAPYIFELGWNLNSKGYAAYSDRAKLTLADQTVLTVSFAPACKKSATDQAVLQALKTLLDRLETGSIALEKPLVVSVTKVDSDLDALAKEYYRDEHLVKFSAIFPALSEETQKEYCNKMFADHRVAFLGATVDDYSKALVAYCLETAYQENNISFFAVVAGRLDDEVRKAWIAKASREDRNTYLAVLIEAGS